MKKQPPADVATEKLQKVLARLGLGSRREIETWIQAGRISVNGTVAKLGDRVDPEAEILVDGKPVKSKASHIEERVIVYNKPIGEICTQKDTEGRRTVFESLPKLRGCRWIMVGRLDVNSQGLLLFTTNGELANRLMHPSYEIEREYAVRVFGKVDPNKIKNLLLGVDLEGHMARFSRIKDAGGEGANHWYHVILREGKYREVRRMWETQDVTVSRLIRIRFADVALPKELRQGKYLELSEADIANLKLKVRL